RQAHPRGQTRLGAVAVVHPLAPLTRPASLGHELLVDVKGPRPVGEDALDDRPHLLPRQPAVAGADARDGDPLDPLRVGLATHAPQRGLDGVVTGPRPPDALLGAEVEDGGPA